MVSRASGANDNASGVAAILEISRILFSIDSRYIIRFVLFSGEEQDLIGQNIMLMLLQERMRILA